MRHSSAAVGASGSHQPACYVDLALFWLSSHWKYSVVAHSGAVQGRALCISKHNSGTNRVFSGFGALAVELRHWHRFIKKKLFSCVCAVYCKSLMKSHFLSVAGWCGGSTVSTRLHLCQSALAPATIGKLASATGKC